MVSDIPRILRIFTFSFFKFKHLYYWQHLNLRVMIFWQIQNEKWLLIGLCYKHILIYSGWWYRLILLNIILITLFSHSKYIMLFNVKRNYLWKTEL